MQHTCGDRPMLGTVLVEQGVVGDGEIEHALSAQATTGEQLGEILVGLGLICRPELDRALAEQSKVALDEEAGFGSGLRAAIERTHRLRREFRPY
jgi:hypothetical protein